MKRSDELCMSNEYCKCLWMLQLRLLFYECESLSTLASELPLQYVWYCGWFKFRGVPIFVVFMEGPIHEFQYPRNGTFLYEL